MHKAKKILGITVMTIITVWAVVSTMALVRMRNQVSEFDRRQGCDVIAGKTADEIWASEQAERLAAAHKQWGTTNIVTHRIAPDEIHLCLVAGNLKQTTRPICILNDIVDEFEKLTPGKCLLVPTSREAGDEIIRKYNMSNVATVKTAAAGMTAGTTNKQVSVRRIAAEHVKAAMIYDARFAANDSTGSIEISFSDQPAVDDLRRGITISPKVEDLTFDTWSQYEWRSNANKYCVHISSKAFKFRQPYTVTVKSDLRFENGAKLNGEFVRKVERPDAKPHVTMADSGRYLPAEGSRCLAIESVNVSLVNCAVWQVLPKNLVQLLAREERQYTKSLPYWNQEIEADSQATTELSTKAFKWTAESANRLNEVEQLTVPLQHENGVVGKGIYLLGIAKGQRNNLDDTDYDEYRLVCVSDIGLSARRDELGIRVWTTSLSTGKPMTNMVTRVYASNGMILCERKTDSNGEVVLDGWDTAYEPFAVVVSTADDSDSTFMAIRESMKTGEPLPRGNRPDYLTEKGCTAYVWTDRGIYRHGEDIMIHAILRNGKGEAPKSFPVGVRLEDTEGRAVFSATAMPDEYGAIRTEGFHAPENRPSGKWNVRVFTPGRKEVTLGEREIKIEEFVPPQVRVKLAELPTVKAEVTNLTFTVVAENLFGGPARKITAEALVAFSDADFVPEGWKGFRFGDASRGLAPNYTRLNRVFTDEKGEASFAVAMKDDWGMPKAAVRMVVQGSVFETGGRPSVTRESTVVHKYPYYLGSNVPKYIRQRLGDGEFTIVQVNPDGTPHRTPRKLRAKLAKISQVYNLVRDGDDYRWDSQRISQTVAIEETVEIGEDGTGKVKLPLNGNGDYELTVSDDELGLSHLVAYWISAGGDDEIRATLKNPTAVAMTADKAVYREGERPRVTLKCPFRGFAWISVMREKTLYTQVIEVTNLTQVVELRELDGAWAPNVDVAVSMVQSVTAEKDHQACRAHGILPLKIRPRISEIPVKIDAAVKCGDRGGSEVKVRLAAKGEGSMGERAVVTVVDEGINLLTNEKVPDPVGYFATERGGWHPLYDVYGRLLPVVDSGLKANGIKTGGDDMAGLMNRVSPVPTRRFKPLSQWQFNVVLTNGVGETSFRLPEFVGEVRITALAYSRQGTGCSAVQQKVCPKLVMQPDAPRFAAPQDRFQLTLTLSNRNGGEGEIEYELQAQGAVTLEGEAKGRVTVADGDSKVLTFQARAKNELGQGIITYRTSGLGENHAATIELPVRPALPWDEHSGVLLLKAGESEVSANLAPSDETAAMTRRAIAVSDTPLVELRAAFDFLAEYPYGCLEQTTSRMFPLLYGFGQKTNSQDIVKAGIRRVESMIRASDFTMWPDCECPPWDREVSLYAAHFLIEAGTMSELGVGAATTEKVCAMLKHWSYDTNTNIAVYACHSLALAGCPNKDRMYSLYDLRAKLPLLSRARLARAFVRIGDPKRARDLVAEAAMDPQDVREAAFALLTLLEMDSKDPRLTRLVNYLQQRRDRERYHWGTTMENAHALLALGAYFQTQGNCEGKAEITVWDGEREVKKLKFGDTMELEGGAEIRMSNGGTGAGFVSVRQLTLPTVATVTNRHFLINVSRRFMTSEGLDVDLNNLKQGDLLIGEIVLTSDFDHNYSDLVIQELLPAGLEPDRKEVAEEFARCHGVGSTQWVLRSDVRDDRIIAFSKPVAIHKETEKSLRCVFYYAVRAITPGEFVLPGTSVEAMYAPEINARIAPDRICVKP